MPPPTTAAANPLGPMMQALVAEMKGLRADLTSGKAPPPAGTPPGQSHGGHGGRRGPLARALGAAGHAAGAIPGVGKVLGPLTSAFSHLLPAIQHAGPGLSGAFMILGAGAGAAAGALAGVVDAAKEMAGLIAPQQLKLFNDAMKDLQATVGVALLPVLQVATGVVRDFGMTLLPLMRELQPVVAQAAQVTAANLGASFGLLAQVIGALVPVFEAVNAVSAVYSEILKAVLGAVGMVVTVLAPQLSLLANVVKLLMVPLRLALGVFNDVTRVVQAFARAVVDTLAGLFGVGNFVDGVQDAAASLRTAFQGLLKAVVLVGATLLKSFGADTLLKKFAENLGGGRKEDNRGLRPAENVKFQDFSSFGREVAVAAATATAAGPGKTQDDWLKQLAGDVEAIRTGKDGSTLLEKLKKILVDEVAPAIGAAIAGAGKREIFGGDAPGNGGKKAGFGDIALDTATGGPTRRFVGKLFGVK